jgi:hypothetical protein
MSDSELFLIWSNEHGAWWGPAACGYVRRIADAGRYSHAQALDICTMAMAGRVGREPLHEIPVRLVDLELMRQRFAGLYPHDPEPPE